VPAARVIRVRNPSRLRSPTRPREETRARLGWQPGDFVVLHSGSIGLKQGLDLAIRASEILGRDSGVRLVLQGDGNERKHLERLAASVPSSSVEFRPLAPADEYAEVLVAADALLLSQRATVRNMALPAKLGSYFASGRPVIAAVHADDEVAREVRAAGAGLIVVPEDPHALVAAIETLRGDRSSAAAFGKAGRSYAERVLSEVTTLRALDEALRAVITRQTTYPAAGPA
jgi:glycosyltransferase involved in cell wall biosynthesis